MCTTIRKDETSESLSTFIIKTTQKSNRKTNDLQKINWNSWSQPFWLSAGFSEWTVEFYSIKHAGNTVYWCKTLHCSIRSNHCFVLLLLILVYLASQVYYDRYLLSSEFFNGRAALFPLIRITKQRWVARHDINENALPKITNFIISCRQWAGLQIGFCLTA